MSVQFTACSGDGRPATRPAATNDHTPPQIVGRIANKEITESSGLAASKCTPNLFWTHNDSGDDAFIFALDETGKTLGTWKVSGAENNDWEDIAEFKDSNGVCYLLVGDIGDNQGKRPDHKIYRFREPNVALTDIPTSRENAPPTEPATVITFTYPDGRHNAETLLVHPASGEIYVLTKRVNGPSGVYRIGSISASGTTVTAVKVADVKVPAIPNGTLTGGDISPDGRRLIICDYASAYELSLPDDSRQFDDIWKAEPSIVDLGTRKVGEAVCYSADGKSIFATSEGSDTPFIKVTRKQ